MNRNVRAASGTDPGRRYKDNFDAMHLRHEPLLAVVSDGMGSGPGPAMAGRTAVELLTAHAGTDIDTLGRAVAEAHQRVLDYRRDTAEFAGATLTALAECTDGTWIVQLGDSRVYRRRDGLLELLTVDHTMAWLGVLHGWYPFDSPQASTARYQLTRYVGQHDRPAPDLLKIELRAGDALLVCTDGISDQVPYQAIADVLADRGDPQRAVAELLATAQAAGAQDNASAVVLFVD